MQPLNRFAFALACSAVTLAAEVLPLNGIWNVAAGSAEPPPEDFAHTVPVPGYLDQADPEFPGVGRLKSFWSAHGEDAPDYGWFWYRRQFELSAPVPAGVRLVIHKAAFGTEVWLNGTRVGEHAPSYTPGWFDLSGKVRPGTNELLVRVGADPSKSDAVSGLEPERRRMLPGIWDEVELHFDNGTYLEDLQIAPSPATGTVRMAAEVVSRERNEIPPLEIQVRELGGNAPLARVKVPLQVREDGTVRLDTVIPLPDFHPWSPEDPFLYEAVVELAGQTVTECFGMRSFEGREGTRPGAGRFLLNGEVYYLRGTNVCYGRWTEDPARESLPWDEDWVRRLFRQWKGLNYNAVRASISPLPNLWYRIADEEGILIQDEYSIWQLDLARISVEQLAAEYRQWMAARWNHPSVVIFDAQNETLHRQNGAITGAALERVRDADLSQRPWDNGWMYPVRPGDASERHPYLLSQAPPEGLELLHAIEGAADRTGEFSKGIYLAPDGAVIPGGLNPLMAAEGYEKVMEWSHHPMIVNEFEWLWLSRDGRPITEKHYRTYLGENATEDDRRALRARVNAMVTEFWRTARTSAAVMNFEGLSFPGPVAGLPDVLHNTSDPYLDVRTLKLDPRFETEIRDANAPTGLMLFFFHREVRAGRTQSIPVLLVNDRPNSIQGTVTLRLENSEGTLLHEDTRPVVLAERGQERLDFEVSIPSTPGSYRLVGELALPGAAPVRSRRDFAATVAEPLNLRVTGEITGRIDKRVFGHFMELVQRTRERGPEAIVDPETGALPWRVEAAVRSLGPTVLRYPGGYLLELPRFSWTHLIDGAFDRDAHERPVHQDESGHEHTHHFGLDEFLVFAERNRAEPLLVVKLADVLRGIRPAEEIIEQAAAIVAYCNAPAGGDLPPRLQRWADLRARNGHPEPWKVKLWQIGNELVWVGFNRLRQEGLSPTEMAEAYAGAVDRVATAMRAVDPSIQLIAEAQMDSPPTNIPVIDALQTRLGDRIDYVSTHLYRSWGIDRLLRDGTPIRADALSPADYWYAAASSPGLVTADGQSRLPAQPFQRAAGAGYPVALTEWNWNSWWQLDEDDFPGQPPRESLWAKGMGAASMLHAILRSTEPIPIATQSMLVGTSWELRSIDVATGRPIRHPSGRVTGLYRHHHGPQRIGWQPVGDWPRYDQPIQLGQLPPTNGVSLVDCIVTADEVHYYLHLINRSLDRSFDLRITLPEGENAAPGQKATLHRLQVAGDEATLRENHEEVAAESLHGLSSTAEGWVVPLPPACLQVAVLPR